MYPQEKYPRGKIKLWHRQQKKPPHQNTRNIRIRNNPPKIQEKENQPIFLQELCVTLT